MAGNSQIIDTVVDPSANKQVTQLTELLDSLDIKMVETTNHANALNASLNGSGTFTEYNKNANAAAIAQAKLTTEQNKAATAAATLQRQQLLLETATNRQTAATQRQIAAQERANKTAAEAERPYTALVRQLREADRAAQDLGVRFGATSVQYRIASENANNLREQVRAVDRPLGNFRDNVGNYANSIGSLFSRAFGAIRTLANIIPNFGIGTFFLLAGEGVLALAHSLDLFNSVASVTTKTQKALQDSFANTDYTKSIENVEKLTVNIQRAKEGFVDKDHVIDEYNNTLGKVAGNVSTLDQAEQGLVKHGEAYIRITLLKAAAALILEEAAKKQAETAKKNQDLQDDVDNATHGNLTFSSFISGGFNASKTQSEAAYDLNIRNQKKIADNNKKALEDYNNSLKSVNKLYGEADDIKKKGGLQGSDDTTGNTGTPGDVATARTKLANARLEAQKSVLQTVIDNEKNSFEKRIAATIRFNQLELQIQSNNNQLALTEKGLSDLQKETLEQQYQNTILSLNLDTNKKVQSLKDAQFAAIKAYYEKAIAESHSKEKLISDNEKLQYDERIQAVANYQKAATALINREAEAEVKQVGDNKEKIKAIREDQKKQLEDINVTTNADIAKLEKERSDKALKAIEDLFATEKVSAEDAINVIQNFTNDELSVLQSARDKEVALLDAKYKKGKITKQQYNDDLLKIDDQYNIDRLGQIAFTEQAALAILQGKENTDVAFARGNGATADQIKKIKSDSGVQQQKQKVAIANTNLGNAVNKQTNDNTQIDLNNAARIRGEVVSAIEDANQLAQEGSKLTQAEYQHELDLLSQKSELIKENAQNEIDAVNNSIASAQTKQNQINIINAQAAAAQQQIANEEKKVKQQQAKYDRELAIAQILEQTAVGEVKAVGQAGIFGIPFSVIIAALGAAQLAVVLATPLPTFATGTENHPGGFGLWGEAGTELAIEPSGKKYFSNGPTVQSMPKGTIIKSHAELLRMAKPETVTYVGGSEIGWQEVVKAINGQKYPKQKRPIVNINNGSNNYLRR